MSFFMPGRGAPVKPQYTGIQLQTSSSNIALTLLWGLNRIAPNIFWYDDFKSNKQKQKTGKGMGGSSTSYTYSASILLGLCQGPITGVFKVFRDEEKIVDYASLGFSLFTGASGQAPWGYLTSNHPTKALSYSGVAYLAASNYDLGSSASTPQHGFETGGLQHNTGPLANGDADVALIVKDLLTDPVFGAGFSLSVLDQTQLLSSVVAPTTGDSAYQTYCRALGIGLSPALSTQEPAGSILERLTRLTDTAIVWTGYSLKLVPRGTETIEGNGYKYNPDLTIAYTLFDDDYVASEGEPPVMVSRTDPADANNSLRLTVKNRANEYNSAPVQWKDQGLIDLYGLREGNAVESEEVCDLDTGSLIVSLIGQREAYSRNTYELTVHSNFCLLEPMDVIVLDDPSLGRVAAWVEELEEQEDFSWRITAKEIPPGIINVGTAQSISNNVLNRAADPGPVNTPVIIQPPLTLTNGLSQVWVGLSGGDDIVAEPLWGGAFVYISVDGVSYDQVGEMTDPSRMGELTVALPAFATANPDTTNTLAVDLGISFGVLQSVSPEEAERAATLTYVGGEYLSYETATLTATYEYDLTTLYRGLYGPSPDLHAIGSSFLRLDESVFKYDLPEDYVGITLYFKFQSYNIWGNALQDLSDCVEYTYVPAGALSPAPTGLALQLGGTSWVGSTIPVVCDPSPGALSYKFYFYLADGVTLKRTIETPTPLATYTASTAATDGISREYKVKVSAVNASGEGSLSDFLTIFNDPPSAVSSPSATGGAINATVSWTAPGVLTDLSGYVVFYSTTVGFDPLSEGSASFTGSTFLTLYGLGAGTYYAVIAPYDPWSFNPDILNLSSEVSFTITTGGGGGVPSGGGNDDGWLGVPDRIQD